MLPVGISIETVLQIGLHSKDYTPKRQFLIFFLISLRCKIQNFSYL